MDEQLRQLERQAASGDPEAKAKLKNMRSRIGSGYNLTLTHEQMDVLQRACDLYTRVQMGQFWSVAEVFFSEDCYHQLRDAANALKPIAFPDLAPNGYHGICSDKTPESAKISWDLQCVMRHRQSWDKLEDTVDKRPFGVNYDTPLHTAKHPLSKISSVDGSRCHCTDPFCKSR